MIVWKKRTDEVTYPADYRCDMCGESCNSGYNFNYMTLYANWGYGIDADGERWEAHVCYNCVKEHLTPKIEFTKKFH